MKWRRQLARAGLPLGVPLGAGPLGVEEGRTLGEAEGVRVTKLLEGVGVRVWGV